MARPSIRITPSHQSKVKELFSPRNIGKSQEEIASEIINPKTKKEIARGTLRKFINGEKVEIDVFEAICTYIGIDPKEYGEGYVNAPDIPIYLPFLGSDTFVGRDIKNLHAVIRDNQYTALSGMAGIGKTELALQYCFEYADCYPGGVAWVTARTEDHYKNDSIGSQIASFVRRYEFIDAIPPNYKTEEDIAQYCYSNWQDGDVLLVIDDVDRFEDIRLLLPRKERFRVIITTRLLLGSPCKCYPVDELSTDDSIIILSYFARKELIDNEIKESIALCEFLGNLPLGVELAGRYLGMEERLSVKSYLEELHNLAEERKVLNHGSLQGDVSIDPTWSLTARRGLDAAFMLSWEKLSQSTQALAILLGGFPKATPIRWSSVERMNKSLERRCPDAIKLQSNEIGSAKFQLLKYNLLKISDVEERFYRVHPLVREFFRDKATSEAYDLFKLGF